MKLLLILVSVCLLALAHCRSVSEEFPDVEIDLDAPPHRTFHWRPARGDGISAVPEDVDGGNPEVEIDLDAAPQKTFHWNPRENDVAKADPTPGGLLGVENCGLRQLERIVNGNQSEHGKWPWMAKWNTKFTRSWCGAVLIDQYHVLSAKHCWKWAATDLTSSTIVLGDHSHSNQGEPGEQRSLIQNVVLHPQSMTGWMNEPIYDVILIRLKEKVNFTQYVQPICLPDAEPSTGLQSYVAGWGYTSNEGAGDNDILRDALLPVVDFNKCNAVYHYNLWSPEPYFCAGYLDGRADSCVGDSGGPLMSEKGGRWQVNGLVSFGKACGTTAGVYTNVFTLADWIRQSVAHNYATLPPQ